MKDTKMKKKKIITIFLLLLPLCIVLLCGGCKKEEELPPNHAKGYIIGVTGGCYSDVVVIEVDKPSDIGTSGSFSTWGKELQFDFENAIGIPYFSKIGIPDSIPQVVGTYLYFEYRELTEEERNNSKLFYSVVEGCPLNLIPPNVNSKIITKIINYEYIYYEENSTNHYNNFPYLPYIRTKRLLLVCR